MKNKSDYSKEEWKSLSKEERLNILGITEEDIFLTRYDDVSQAQSY